MGYWNWQRNIPDPEVYQLNADTIAAITGCKLGEPKSEGVFSVAELKRRNFVGVYSWVASQNDKEALV